MIARRVLAALKDERLAEIVAAFEADGDVAGQFKNLIFGLSWTSCALWLCLSCTSSRSVVGVRPGVPGQGDVRVASRCCG